MYLSDYIPALRYGAIIDAPAGMNLDIVTQTDNKPVRINSKTASDSTLASQSLIGFQCKPRSGVTRTADIYGAEFEPGFNNTFGGTSLIGVASRPTLKGTTGNLSGDVRAYEAAIGSDVNSSRVVSGTMSALWATNNCSATVTGGIYVIHALAAGDSKNWSGFAKLPNDDALAYKQATDITPGNLRGYIKVNIGGTNYFIPAYDGMTK